MTRRILGLLACMAAVLSLAACTPAGRAVGDTQDSMPEVAHDSTHPTDVTVGFVGSTDTAADKSAINALSDDKLNVYYARSKHPQARQTQLMVYPVKPNLLTPAIPTKTVPIVRMLILASTRMRPPHSRVLPISWLARSKS